METTTTTAAPRKRAPRHYPKDRIEAVVTPVGEYAYRIETTSITYDPDGLRVEEKADPEMAGSAYEMMDRTAQMVGEAFDRNARIRIEYRF